MIYLNSVPTSRKRYIALVLMFVAILILSACTTDSAPSIEAQSTSTGFEFRVDPQSKTVTPLQTVADAATNQLSTQAVSAAPRILVPNIDIAVRDLSFQFTSATTLVTKFRLDNISEFDYDHPFFFALSSESDNIVSTDAPLITKESFNGNGVLIPGETSELFEFEVEFREGEPFTFVVDTWAVVRAARCNDPVNVPDADLQTLVREELGLAEDAVVTCDALTSLTKLEDELSIRLRVANLEGLQYASNLTALTLYYSEFTDVEKLKNLENLVEFGGAFGSLEDLSAFAELTQLTDLVLFENDFTDISPLASLSELEFLSLGFNDIADFSPISSLVKLERLVLQRVGLTDLRALSELSELRFLFVSRNEINDLSGLETLTNLEELGLSDNNISDIQPLVDNPGLDAGDFIRINNNPLSAEAFEDIETLRARGVEVLERLGNLN